MVQEVVRWVREAARCPKEKGLPQTPEQRSRGHREPYEPPEDAPESPEAPTATAEDQHPLKLLTADELRWALDLVGYSRNPIYVSFALLYFGIVVLRNALWTILLLPLVLYVCGGPIRACTGVSSSARRGRLHIMPSNTYSNAFTPAGTVVKLDARAAANSKFVGWESE